MPEAICAECGYEARDKSTMERHMNRKYPCNSLIIASKEKLEVKKMKDVNAEELEKEMKEKEKTKLKFKMKPNTNYEKNKLEKEEKI